jgi:hypothetical protein
MPNLNDLVKARKRRKKGVPAQPFDPNNVMPAQCASCPWRDDGGILHEQPEMLAHLQRQVIEVPAGNQFCHAPAFAGQPEDKICRGARNFQLKVFYNIGFLPEPTDQAWREATEQIAKESEERTQ